MKGNIEMSQTFMVDQFVDMENFDGKEARLAEYLAWILKDGNTNLMKQVAAAINDLSGHEIVISPWQFSGMPYSCRRYIRTAKISSIDPSEPVAEPIVHPHGDESVLPPTPRELSYTRILEEIVRQAPGSAEQADAINRARELLAYGNE